MVVPRFESRGRARSKARVVPPHHDRQGAVAGAHVTPGNRSIEAVHVASLGEPSERDREFGFAGRHVDHQGSRRQVLEDAARAQHHVSHVAR